MTDRAAHAVPDMRARVLRGLGWVAASQVGAQLTRAVVAIAIARMLTPEEYGLAALALVFSSLVLVFSDMALGAALLQRKTLTEHDRNTAFWVMVASGTLFTAAGVALSGPIASLYGDPDAKPLLMVLSGTFLVSALGATQSILMLREMDFRRLEMLPMLGIMVGGAAGVALAATGAGAWAIIAQYVVATAVTTIMYWVRSAWQPRFLFSLASLRDLAGFSIYMVGHRMLYYLQVNGDRFLIGRFIGTAALGTYAVAYNTMLVPASKLGGPIQRVMSPAFCRMQDEPDRIAAAWARVTRLLATVSVPALAGLVVVAPDFVPVVLGGQWTEAVPVVQILAWVGIVQALQSLNNDILMARDRTRTIFRFTLVLTSAHLVAFTVGLEWGIIGVAVAYAVSTTLVEPFQSVLAARALGVSPLVFFRSVGRVFQAAFGMCAVVLAVRWGLIDAGVDGAARLILCIAAGAIAYVPLCAWRVPEVAEEVRDLLRRRAGGGGATSLAAPAGP
jgi:O-antigen/teichoic acid export membrane protein